jgi:fused signal recognition particle receptor
MFSGIKGKIRKIYGNFTSKLQKIFHREKESEKNELRSELEKLLLSADMGTKKAKELLDKLFSEKGFYGSEESEPSLSKLSLLLTDELAKRSGRAPSKGVFMLVGVNGSGKTSFAAKLANKLKEDGQKVLLVAADTFRAAAQEQLENMALKFSIEIFKQEGRKDPASVVFDACEKYKKENYDSMIIDTAGRLQTKQNLMKELEKINRILTKKLPDEKIYKLLVIDGMLGQNSVSQAKIFSEATELSGIVLTKMDGTGKGGAIFTICAELNLPVLYMTFGEGISEMAEFNAKDYVSEIVGNTESGQA